MVCPPRRGQYEQHSARHSVRPSALWPVLVSGPARYQHGAAGYGRRNQGIVPDAYPRQESALMGRNIGGGRSPGLFQTHAPAATTLVTVRARRHGRRPQLSRAEARARCPSRRRSRGTRRCRSSWSRYRCGRPSIAWMMPSRNWRPAGELGTVSLFLIFRGAFHAARTTS